MSRYRKIETRIWGDERFRNLTPLQPSGQALWLFILTGPHTGPIPGIYRASRAAMADELGWDMEAFDEAFREAFREGMAEADWKAKVLWVPNAIKYNKPESANVITSWATEWDLIPECDLKREAYETIRTSLYAASEAYGKAFDKACAKPSQKPIQKPIQKASPKTCANQQQQQEREQDKVKSLAGRPIETDQPINGELIPLPASPAGREKKTPESNPELQAACKATWDSYAAAYRAKYGVAPVRNAPVNTQIRAIVQRLGYQDSPHVAAFYLTHGGAYYARRMHDTGTLLRDCEKLRTEWATGRKVTAASARQTDRTQTNLTAMQDAMTMLQGEPA